MWDARGLLPAQLLHPRLTDMLIHQNAPDLALSWAAHRALEGRVRMAKGLILAPIFSAKFHYSIQARLRASPLSFEFPFQSLLSHPLFQDFTVNANK